MSSAVTTCGGKQRLSYGCVALSLALPWTRGELNITVGQEVVKANSLDGTRLVVADALLDVRCHDRRSNATKCHNKYDNGCTVKQKVHSAPFQHGCVFLAVDIGVRLRNFALESLLDTTKPGRTPTSVPVLRYIDCPHGDDAERYYCYHFQP